MNRLTWVGHATVLLEIDGVRVLTDPFVRARPLHLRRHAPPPDPAALRRLDAVLISHLHADHLDLPSLRRLDPAVPLVVPRGAGRFLERAGFAGVRELSVGESLSLGALVVTAVRADHDRHRRPRGPVADPLGYVVEGTSRAYFAGDTALFPELADLARTRIDVALLPIWGWGPKLGPGHMDPHDAARAVALVQPAVAVPIHWGTYFPQGLASRRRMAFVDAPRIFVDDVALLAPEVEVQVLAPGDGLALQAVSAAPG